MAVEARYRGNVSIWPSLLVGLSVRIGLMLYGAWQDANMRVKFTDVDYHVFTDAAQHVVQGESPYKRATYRYTPLLAWMLTLNIYWTPLFGKVMFILCDIVAGHLIYSTLLLRSCSGATAVFCAQLWLLNPLPMAVSSRGNAESIMAVLVVATLYCLMHGDSYLRLLGFCLFAASVHVKIYPFTYALPIYLFLGKACTGHRPPQWFKQFLPEDLWPNRTRVTLVFTAISVFGTLTLLGYIYYGDEFLQETYFYHLTRRDIRHNFSVYFYMLYLWAESPYAAVLGLVVFLPQLILLVVISFRYYHDLPMCCFLQTCVFVTFNKVCTSQYFLWYLSLLPLVVPSLSLSVIESALLLLLWFVTQGLWLSPAYYLEFEGMNQFVWIWIAGLVFFCTNTAIIGRLAQTHIPSHVFQDGRRCAMKFRHIPTLGETVMSFIRTKKKES